MDKADDLMSEADDLITNMRTYISDLEKRLESKDIAP